MKEFVQDAAPLNAAAHVIGSFNLAGIMDGDTIHWRAVNDMELHSFAGGSWSTKFKIPSLLQDVDRPLPFGTTRQTVLWDTDLHGRYRRR